MVPYVGTVEDDYGNETPSYGQPRTRYVYGWGPGGDIEVNGFRQTVTADLVVYAPPGFPVGSRDRVRVLDVDYDVEGLPQDFNHGPFGYEPGVTVNLRRRGA